MWDALYLGKGIRSLSNMISWAFTMQTYWKQFPIYLSIMFCVAYHEYLMHSLAPFLHFHIHKLMKRNNLSVWYQIMQKDQT